MWRKLSDSIYSSRWLILAIVLLLTVFMAWKASQVRLSYSFTNNIPQDNPIAQNFNRYQEIFGDDANSMVLAFQNPDYFNPDFLKDLSRLNQDLEGIEGVKSSLSLFNSFDINTTDSAGQKKLITHPYFNTLSSEEIKASEIKIQANQFYKNLLFNPDKNAFLMLLNLDSTHANSVLRNEMMQSIEKRFSDFGESHGISTYLSGLPYIRTNMALKVQNEMRFFLILSVLVTSLILLVLFRSFGLLMVSLGYVFIGIIWSVGLMGIFDYEITLLTALLPPLVVIISVPNTIYFINTFHTAYAKGYTKVDSIRYMIEKIGVVTLFTNLTTAVGFGVFAFTSSQILHEFGVVAGITIGLLFILAIIILPLSLSLLPAPKKNHLKYMTQNWKNWLFDKLKSLIIFKRQLVWTATGIVLVFSLWGITRLDATSYIVDDLPKGEKLYQDLLFFEEAFGGVMPLEIIVDAKRENRATSFGTLKKIDRLSRALEDYDFLSRPISVAEGIKFARQAYYDGEASAYAMPNNLDISFFAPYLRRSDGEGNALNSVSDNFLDKNSRFTRISYRMKDIGTQRMDEFMDSISLQIHSVFDSTKYDVFTTGTSVSFLEGSKYIIHSLGSSLILAFLVIFACIFYLFKSWRFLLVSIVVNLIPLIITAGIMGWMGIRIKPSTVLVFSIALGITVDMTIRFMVNFRQEQEANPSSPIRMLTLNTISETGVSIIFTTLVLAFGFSVFAMSSFDGTRALGILIPITIVNAMIANLSLLPSLLISFKNKLVKR